MRYEFSKPVKRAALKRSDGLCEAVGEVYGLPFGQRCNSPLSHGVEFDHWPIPATDAGSDTLDNCMTVCPSCHRRKTSSYDIPMQAKGKRVSDNHLGIRQPSRLQSRGFEKRPKQHSATRAMREK